MSGSVGIAELRQDLSRYLRRVERGERLIVTDRNRPVAELSPPPSTGAELDGPVLLAAGALSEPALRALDAIHIAAAAGLSPLDAFVSYDERQAAAARLARPAHHRPGKLSSRL